MCHRNMLLQLVARPVHGSDLSSRRVPATCRLVCTDLKWLGTKRDMDEPWQAWQVHPKSAKTNWNEAVYGLFVSRNASQSQNTGSTTKSSSKTAHDCGQPLIGCWAPISLSISRTRYPCPAEQTTGVGTPCMGTYNVPTLPISLESVVSLSTQSAGQE